MHNTFGTFERRTLSNGLRIHSRHDPGCPWVIVAFLVNSGAAHDADGCEGTAHFMEHLVSENCGSTKQEIDDYFDSIGGRAELGATSFTHTFYRFFVPADAEQLKRALAIYGSMLIGAKLTKFVERERQVVRGEYAQHYAEEFRHELLLAGLKEVYGDSWRSRAVSPLGTLDSIARITEGDLQAFYDRNYVPHNMDVVVIGGVGHDDIARELSQSPFGASGDWGPVPPPQYMEGVSRVLAHPEMTFSTASVLPDVTSGEVTSLAKIGRAEDPYALGVFLRCLDYFLFEEVREKHAWTYHIGSMRQPFHDCYEVGIDAQGLAPESFDSIRDVISECVAMVPQQKERFLKMRSATVNQYRLHDQSGWDTSMEAMMMLMQTGRVVSEAERIEAVQEVTLADMERIAWQLAPDKRWTLLMRP